MDLVPKRKSLLAATTAVLRDAIAAGEWSGELPGERKLCERMQVGRDTLRLALKQLEREGVIGRGDPGRRRPILKQSKCQSGSGRGAGKIGSIAYLTPHALERLTETSLAEVDVLRAQLADSGFRLEIVNSPAFGMKRPASSLKKLVNDSKVDAWIFHQTFLSVCSIGWRQRGISKPNKFARRATSVRSSSALKRNVSGPFSWLRHVVSLSRFAVKATLSETRFTLKLMSKIASSSASNAR